MAEVVYDAELEGSDRDTELSSVFLLETIPDMSKELKFQTIALPREQKNQKEWPLTNLWSKPSHPARNIQRKTAQAPEMMPTY